MTALATDDFNRANSLLNTGNWSTQTGEANIQIVSNQATNFDDLTDEANNYNAVTWPNNQYAQAVITVTAGYTMDDGAGIGLRMSTSAQTYYRFIVNSNGSNNVSIGKKISGAFTNIVRRSSTFTNGNTFYGEIQGTTLQAKINGVNAGSSTTDSAISTGRTGLTYSSEASDEVVTWDSWEGGDFAAGAQDTPELYGRPYGERGERQMTQILVH